VCSANVVFFLTKKNTTKETNNDRGTAISFIFNSSRAESVLSFQINGQMAKRTVHGYVADQSSITIDDACALIRDNRLIDSVD
jgi:hypothetical protein